ncbi:DUF2726 domain-containing protein [uncultured Roseibium sp.]|uniref:DUF2726 domain-containing protein n=1 Tax=uncultured Roseibium sp. TaxID=1936171 RepID=UPI003216E545
MLRLVNRYEEIAHGQIKLSADRWGLSVYPKVRVADVISLDGINASGDLRRYGLQSHFDFVVCREKWNPIYSIEFDGRFHSTEVQKARDAKKDELCRRADFPILRINSRYLSKEFGSMSLVAWIMDVFELQEGFYNAQEEGAIPPDEPFDPFFFMGMESGKERFPYWFSAKPRIELRKLYEAGKIFDPSSSGFIGYDAADVMRGVEYIRVTETEGILVRSAMRPQQFPIILSDLLDEILSVQLAEEVLRWVRGEVRASPLRQIYRQVDTMKESIKLARAHSFNRSGDGE